MTGGNFWSNKRLTHKVEVMVRHCLATLHRPEHPGKHGNCETWDGVLGPNPSGEGWVNAGDWGVYGKLPTSLDRALGSVSQISIATQFLKKIGKILTVSCGPKQQKSVRVSGHDEDWETCVWGLTIVRLSQSIMGRWHHRYPIMNELKYLQLGLPSPPLLRRALNPEISAWCHNESGHGEDWKKWVWL